MKKQKIIPQIWRFFKPFRRHFIVILCFISAIQGISLILPYFLAKIIDAVSGHLPIVAFTYIGLSFLLAVLSNSILNTMRDRYEIANIDFDRETHMHLLSLSRLLGLSIGQYRNEHTGIKQHVVSQGQNSLSQIVDETIFSIVPTLVQVVTTLVVITYVSLWVGLFVSALIIIYLALTIYRNVRYYPKMSAWLESEKESSKLTSEIYRNAPLVILEAQEQKVLDLTKKIEGEHMQKSKAIWLPYVLGSGFLRVFVNIARYGGLALVLYFIFQGSLSTGMFIAFFGWISQSTQSVEMITHQQRRFMILLGRIRKYFDILDIKTDVPMIANPKIPENFEGEIEFRNVSYNYPSREAGDDEKDTKKSNSIHSLNFKINAGEKIGIVGESGAGKSTLVNLLRRSFDPQKGEILVGGVPLKELDLHWYRSNMGNVEQDVAIFDLSVRDNILFGMNGKAKDVSDKELLTIARMASIDRFIKKLEKGFDTMIGERGIKLSGGERQRVAIARALIKNPKVLIFDEATSALDAFNEELIHSSIKEAAVGRTTIIIAHRLSTVIDADRILVMDKGKLVDSGSHDELQGRCPEYQKLIKNQVVAI